MSGWESALGEVLRADGWECAHCAAGVGLHFDSRAGYFSAIAPARGTASRRRWDERMRSEHGAALVAEVHRIQHRAVTA